jgi:Flp pilus assembly protein TadD
MFAAVLSGGLHAKGDQETAIAVAKEGQRINPNDMHTGLVLCSALAEAGRNDEARLVAVNLLRPGTERGVFHQRATLSQR